MTNNEFAKLRLVKDVQKTNHELKLKLSSVKNELQKQLSEIEDMEKEKYTEQYALFSVDEKGKYHFQKIIDISEEDCFGQRIMNDLEERRMEEWFDGDASNLRESRIAKARADIYAIKGARI